MVDTKGGPSLAGLVRDGVLDAELAGLLSLLAGARTPIVVVSPGPGPAAALAASLALELPAGTRTVVVRPDDDFDWLREAVELGWRRERMGERPAARDGIGSADGVLVASRLGSPHGIAGGRARIVVRALALGYGLLATADGEAIDDLLAALAAPAVGTDEDERSRLGVVIVLGSDGDAAGQARVVAAHYVRPTALDPHGHVQRMPPAVLATWNPARNEWDHFAWGVLAELGDRVRRSALELEREQARRASAITSEAAGPDV